MIDVALAIDPEAISLTLHERAGGNYDLDGFWVDGAEVPRTIMASVQPTNPRELKDMPEGIRTEAVHTMRTRERITEDEEITYLGQRWRILKVARWPSYSKAWLGLKADE